MADPKAVDMPGNEAIEMMKRAAGEIRELRATIERLKPKAHAYDQLSAVLGLLPQPSQGYGEDVAWMLDKRIAELEKARKPEPTPAPGYVAEDAS